MRHIRHMHMLKSLSLVSLLVFGVSLAAPNSSYAFWPWPNKDDEIKPGQVNTDNASVDKYGFEKVDKSVEQERLLGRLKYERQQLDSAIDNTKDLIAQSYQKPYMPELLLRLAELYVEKSRVAYFQRRTEGGAAIRSSLDSLESNALKTKAIETYLKILNNFPEYEHRGKVHFYLAHEYRELKRPQDMVKHYEAIITEESHSKYVAEAYLLLGDHYFDNKLFGKAQHHYEKVLEHPNTAALSIARYKLAWVHINNRDFASATKLLEAAVKAGGNEIIEDVDTYERVNVRREALIDLAFVYTDHYEDHTPDQTLGYFKEYAWSRPVYIVVLEKLANRYLLKRKWSHAEFIYRELSDIQPDPKKVLEYAENIYNTSRQQNSFAHADRDVRNIISALKKIKYSVHYNKQEKQALINTNEIYARDLATRLHTDVKKTKDPEKASKVASAYKHYLEFFNDAENHEKMSLNYAETLFLAGDYVESGKVYEKLSKTHSTEQPSDSLKSLLYSATVSYHKALKEKREQLNYYELVQATAGLSDTGAQYAALFPNSDRTANVKFNVAWIKYDEGDFKEAIPALKKFIEQYPATEEAAAAIKLTVDAYLSMEDYESLTHFDDFLLGINGINKESLQDVIKIAKSSENRIINELTVASVENWESGKEALREYAESKGSSSLGQAALKALFISSKEQNDIETMYTTAFEHVNKYPQSQDSKDMLNALVDVSIRSNQFRVLVETLERHVRTFPGESNAKDFLLQAAQLRAQLGEPELAKANYLTLIGEYPVTMATLENALTYVVKNHVNARQYDTAIRLLEQHKNRVSQSQQGAIAASLANLYVKTSNYNAALPHYRKALKLHQGNDPQYTANLAETAYAFAQLETPRYFETRLSGEIDPGVIERKTSALEQLTNRYAGVLNLKSPEWSVLACYRMHEINKEYARFLLEAPVPEMSPEETAEYKALIAEQAQPYIDEANQYLDTGIQLAHKIESFSERFRDYETSLKASEKDRLVAASPSLKIAIDAFQDTELRTIHNSLARDPNQPKERLALAKAYLSREDLGHANVILQSLLEVSEQFTETEQSEIHELLGIIALSHEDENMAVAQLEKAIQLNAQNHNAKLHLGAIYQHYGLRRKSSFYFSDMPSLTEIGSAAWTLSVARNQYEKWLSERSTNALL